MNNFELIDDYLSNRLSGADKEAFEKQLQNDPALRSDLDFQKQVISGIRQARAKELKAMLNNVPVPAGASVNVEFAIARLAAGLITATVVGSALYFYMKPDELPSFNKAAADFNHPTEQTAPADTTMSNEQPADEAPREAELEDEATPSGDVESKPAAKKIDAPVVTPATKPTIEVTNPSDELSEANETDVKITSRPMFSPSRVEVQVDSSEKKYDFHYQFAGNKLRLYGSFDSDLYEVLEINGDNRTVFLFYKDMFYLLDEKQDKITRLTEIKDSNLLAKLRQYRNQ